MQPFRNLVLIIILLSLITMNAHSQQPVKNYETEWKQAEDFIKKNLPKSALTVVKNIYSQAKKEMQDAQIIKSLLYRTNLQQETREDNETVSIKEIEKEIPGTKEPAASILKSMLAGMYWNYFQDNRWNLYDRSETMNFKKEDIATWSTEDFFKKVNDLYLQSIREEKLLQQVKLDDYNAIITKGNVRYLRPTLYDLLAHQALAYFENDESDLKKPAYAFEIDQAAAFDPVADFIHHKFITNDSLSLHHKALLIYQKLLAFHSHDEKPDALVDADIARLQFVYRYSVHPDKEDIYFAAINHLARQYENLPSAAQAWYLLAIHYNQLADAYKPYGDSTHRMDKIKAKEICEKVIAQKEQSEGWANCYNLLQQIIRPALQFSVEKINIPDLPFRMLVEYKSFNTLYLRIIKADEKLKTALTNRSDNKYWQTLIAANTMKSWQQDLPATNDMQEHAVELPVDALPSGDYILLASTDNSFSVEKSLMGARMFYVSSISYVNQASDYFVLNRESGQPLANASVQVYEQQYNSKTYRYDKVKGNLYKTDANGFFKITSKKQDYGYSFYLDISYGNERLNMDEVNYNYYYSNEPAEQDKENITTFLFTDRSIYRPAQTVFFKGIVVSKKTGEKESKIKTGYKTTIILHNVNDEEVDSMDVVTNEFGSFSGKFQLPKGTLNGEFSLSMKNNEGSTSFSVEEYKRPKFYVDYEPVKGTYKVNDTVTIVGLAKAYAGNNIDGADVKYRVVRQPRFIYPWLFRRWYMPPSDEMEITHGEIKTGKDGKFRIAFKAIPDLKVDRKFDPVFDYTVYADVTDINGETRSGEQSVSVSYQSLMLTTTVPSSMPVDSLKTISIRTENMNGEFEPAIVKLTISRLKEEKRLIRDRYWQRPDEFILSKEEYIKLFPFDEYDNETDKESWAKEKTVYEKTDSSKENQPWTMDHGQLSPGFYIVETETKDKDGNPVKDVQYLELYNDKSNQLNHPEYLWTDRKNNSYEPGQTATVTIGSAADNLFVIQQTDRSAGNENRIAIYNFYKLSQEKKSFSFPVTETDRGGFGVGYLFVKHNRLFSTAQTITVPWSNKELQISYESFRDKTLPGSEEKWKVKIAGYKKEKVAAEMLATMYDASLDQFQPHSWIQPSLWPHYYALQRWDGNKNFSQVLAEQKWLNDNNYKSFDKRYDDLNFDSYSGRKQYRFRSLNYTMRRTVRDEEIITAKLDTTAVASLDDPSKPIEYKVIAAKNNDGVPDKLDKENKDNSDNTNIQIRKNFNETAFFFPGLTTDSSGSIEFSFTMPEALTKWKFMALAYTKDLAFGSSTKEIVTQKELMVQPNMPRFLREGDRLEFSAKIVNLSDTEITGQAELQLMDAATNQPVDGWFKNAFPNQYFTVAAGQSDVVLFPIEVPYQFNTALTWRIVARAGNKSDGEEDALPVLTNRMLVTESLPIGMRGTGTKNFTFTKLLNSGSSETLKSQSLTFEYTSNPAWYAVQALPYLIEYPYECAEQTWNRYYANSLASMIANSSPRIKEIFSKWKNADTSTLLSNLQKNEELKSVLLEETPWVLEAKTEEQQKKNIALLFDMVKMSDQLTTALEKLKQQQLENGGFAWFNGGPDDRYITQYIITGIGHLKKLNAFAKGQESALKEIVQLAIPYLDKKIKEDYDNLKKYKLDINKEQIGYSEVQYLYMRSFFPEYPVANGSVTAYNYYRGQAQKFWTNQSKYMQGMIALALNRTGDIKTPAAILKSLKETSISNDELGMYWKELSSRGWFWYQAPIETQSLLIEAFNEVGKDRKTTDDLRTWLLKNKQTNNWKTTKATAEACYALLLSGTEWLTNAPVVTVQLGNTEISSSDNQQEAGTGYFKKIIEGNKVNPQMGNITLSISSSTVPLQGDSGGWGSVYWQYFEDLDKITPSATPLKLDKKLFIETNTERGPVLTPVNDGDVVKVGDKIKVRIELRADRDMEYVHMKDMRASCLEPVNVLSGYKWQGGLGYYESTKDASTNFFFDYLRKGTWVFEYELFVTHAGNFSNGVTSIQCMYAPEFSSHSEGIRINTENNSD